MQTYHTRNTRERPAFRLMGDCPDCHSPLVLRHSRAGHQPFIGCSYYPLCRYTLEYDEALQTLGRQLREGNEMITELRRMTDNDMALLHERDIRIGQLQLTVQALQGQLASQRPTPRTTSRLTPQALDGELLALLTICHPDKWADHPACTEMSKAVLGLRQRVKEGRV